VLFIGSLTEKNKKNEGERKANGVAEKEFDNILFINPILETKKKLEEEIAEEGDIEVVPFTPKMRHKIFLEMEFKESGSKKIIACLEALMPEVKGSRKFWQEKALELLEMTIPIAVFKRDHGHFIFDINGFHQFMLLENIIRISHDPTLPDDMVRELGAYLMMIPGYQKAFFNNDGSFIEDKKVDYPSIRQFHNHVMMEFMKPLLLLEYGT
ncbi:MAG: icmO, partial [Alphaproteobacteria bacterium]|nr:icmO [Alphaproteobacteria bacterium]